MKIEKSETLSSNCLPVNSDSNIRNEKTEWESSQQLSLNAKLNSFTIPLEDELNSFLLRENNQLRFLIEDREMLVHNMQHQHEFEMLLLKKNHEIDLLKKELEYQQYENKKITELIKCSTLNILRNQDDKSTELNNQALNQQHNANEIIKLQQDIEQIKEQITKLFQK